MAAKTPQDEKLQSVDFDLFEAIAAIDRKDYGYWDRLTSEQQRKFVPYMMLHWISAVKGGGDIQSYYLCSTDYHANMHMFNEAVQTHPKLQWLMLCASSPGRGKQFHQWIPHLSNKISELREEAKPKEIREYLKKKYSRADDDTINSAAQEWVATQNRSVYLAKNYPHLKLDDIATLNAITSDQEIEQHRQDTTF